MPSCLFVNRSVVVVLAKVDASNAEVCKSNLVSGDKGLAMALKSSIQQIPQFLPGFIPLGLICFFPSCNFLCWTGECSKNWIVLHEIDDGIDLPLSLRICGVVAKFDCDCARCCLGLVDFDTLNSDFWERSKRLFWFNCWPLFETNVISLPICAGVNAHHSDELSTTIDSEVLDLDWICLDHLGK